MRIPDKTRYLNAVKHIECDEVPFFEMEIDTAVAAKILGKELKWVRPYELPVKDYIELNLRAGNDMVFYQLIWELGRNNMIDAEGRKHYVDGTIKTREDLAKITYPNLDDVRRQLDEVCEALDGTGLGLMYTPNGAPFITTVAMGYQDYYVNMIDDPAFIHEFQDKVNEYCLKQLELVLSYPVDVIQLGVAAFSKSGPVTSLDMIEEFELSNLRHEIKMVKEKGIPVSLHVDGDFTSIIPDFIEMGVDVINPWEPCDGNVDIYKMKEKWGDRLSFHGNIDIGGVLAYGTPEEVAADTLEHLRRLAPGGGYVCASSHDISEVIPIENLFAMRDTVHAFKLSENR